MWEDGRKFSLGSCRRVLLHEVGEKVGAGELCSDLM